MLEHKYDREADAIYINLRAGQYAYGKNLDDERRIDYASNNQIIGIELLSASRGVNLYELPYEGEIINVLREYGIPSYKMIPYPDVDPTTGTTSITFGIQLGSEEDEELDGYKGGIKEELTGVS